MNQTLANSKSPDPFEPLLKESVQRFLTQYKNGATDFSNFTSIFSRMLQNLPDPPLEFVWFYAALTFHSTKFAAQQRNPVNRVSLVKDLFQLLVSCSNWRKVTKKIALLAPVIYECCQLIFDRKDSKRDIEGLLEGIISYISICCGVEPEDDREDLSLNSCFADLLRVWMVDQIGESSGFGEDLRFFLPIVSDHVRNVVVLGQCGVQYLAGVVMCEAFLLRLCLKFGLGISRAEMEKDVHDCAVQMITGFRSFHFFDALIGMLLEPVLPVPPLLYFVLLPGSEGDVLLREVLYDAVLTVKYSFLSLPGRTLVPGKDLKNLLVTWLFVADNAIRFVRDNGDQAKITSYISAFSESCLPSQLINWVISQIGNREKISKPNVSTPISLIKWLLHVEDQGVRVFDCHVSKIYAKAAVCKSREVYELPLVKQCEKNLGGNICYTDNEVRGEDSVNCDVKMVDSMDAMFMNSPGFVKPMTNGTRKRKEGRENEEEMQVKFVKYQLREGDEILPLGNNDGLNGGSEVDHLVTNEDMEVMEH